MNLLLLLALLMLTMFLTLWIFLAMASWSDRQLASAFQEWLERKADTGASAERLELT
jgi:sensor domain CHASE-containing protein